MQNFFREHGELKSQHHGGGKTYAQPISRNSPGTKRSNIPSRTSSATVSMSPANSRSLSRARTFALMSACASSIGADDLRARLGVLCLDGHQEADRGHCA